MGKRTPKKCPVCEQEYYGIKLGELCYQCKSDIERMRSIESIYSELSSKFKKVYKFRQGVNDFIYIQNYLNTSGKIEERTDKLEKVQIQIEEVITDAAVFSPTTKTWQSAIKVSENFEDKLKQLKGLISDLLQETYDAGVKAGRNLLFNLNAGTITLDDLNKSATDKKD